MKYILLITLIINTILEASNLEKEFANYKQVEKGKWENMMCGASRQQLNFALVKLEMLTSTSQSDAIKSELEQCIIQAPNVVAYCHGESPDELRKQKWGKLMFEKCKKALKSIKKI